MRRDDYTSLKVPGVSGRYLPPEKLMKILPTLGRAAKYEILGRSIRGLEIPWLRLGSGPTRILIWSQMHGNETTTTKALLDLIHGISLSRLSSWEDTFSLFVIPMLNPDGSRVYTRENANGIDLNRDALERTQIESQLLDRCFSDVQPHFCLNLHDQRTIYNPDGTDVSTTLAFLAPSLDEERSATGNRLTAMRLIAAIADSLPSELHDRIARYDDTFNPHCVGDRFQQAGVPTLLFEAGHFPGDYAREHTRYYMFRALTAVLEAIHTGGYRNKSLKDYEAIPPNTKDFTDLKILNPGVLDPRYKGKDALALHFREVLRNGEIQFIPDWPEEGLSSGRFAHRILDAQNPEDRVEIYDNPQLYKVLF